MRTLKFREVLHGVAYKLGLDPEQGNFLTNQAIPIGTYVEQWVRRVYDSRDWPELTVINRFTPVDHIVPWDVPALAVTDTPKKIGRVLKVYLLDPDETSAPVSTEFTLVDSGVHCGFEHGTYVWIRYLIPAPRFSAVEWDATETYSVDDVVYSSATGECYRSKSDGNSGVDPGGSTGGVPPIVTIIQVNIPPTPTVTVQPKIVEIAIGYIDSGAGPVILISDPAPVGDTWQINITDSDSVVIGTATYTVSGSATDLATIVTSLASDLQSDLGGTFAVTPDVSSLTLSVEDASEFFVQTGTTHFIDTTPTLSYLGFNTTQIYISAVVSDPGQPQIIRLTMTDETTVPGSTYGLVLTDSRGRGHTAEYESAISDGAAQILNGLVAAIQASSDSYWQSVQLSLGATGTTLDFIIAENFSLHPSITLVESSSWWDLIPFPRVLSEQVMRGAYGDLLKEWGQFDKAAAEEQAVPAEMQIAEGDFTTTPNPPLTGQQLAKSRYRLS